MPPTLAPAPRIDESLPFVPVRIAVLTVSDTRSQADDRSGDTRAARLTEAGQPYLDEWVARADAAGLDGQALLDEYRGLIAQYTQELETQGYPWERG